MNFLRLRSLNQAATHDQQSINESADDPNFISKKGITLGGLIAEDVVSERASTETDDYEYSAEPGSSGTRNIPLDSHTDVTEEDGRIIIPSKEVPDNWMEEPDMVSYESLDRSFVFPGEQIRILARVSSGQQDIEIITPFKVAAAINKSGGIQSPFKRYGKVGEETCRARRGLASHGDHQRNDDDDGGGIKRIHSETDVLTGESLLRMEEHRLQTERMLQRFKNSHFFARISESDEPLWSKRIENELNQHFSERFQEKLSPHSSETGGSLKKNSITAVIDSGEFDAQASGGVTRGAVQCCSLLNGDIVVLLHLNVGVEIMRDPVLEILQFEKYNGITTSLENENLQSSTNHDPSGDLLKWLFPLNNNNPSSPRPPTLSSSSSIRAISKKPPVTTSSGSQLLSLGHFRSYSMSSLPQNTLAPETLKPPSPVKPSFEPEDWDEFSFNNFSDTGRRRNQGLLSFRGVPLIPERFSIRCGLEGLFTPGRRWRRKIKLIQPIEIHSFSVDCYTDDFLCVHVKNVSPEFVADIIVFIDSVAIVFDEASNTMPPSPVPTVCTEAGNGYCLPNVELRRGEEHSFILKPKMTLRKCSNSQKDSNARTRTSSSARPSSVRLSSPGSVSSSWHQFSNREGRHNEPPADQYAVLVSCHCNYTESKLFFKQPIRWRPRVPKDLMISIAAEVPKQTTVSNGTCLPVQILTLQASNMSSDDMTLTVLAPVSYSYPCVMSPNDSPFSPSSPVTARTNFAYRENMIQRYDNEDEPQSVRERPMRMSDAGFPDDLSCTHLWLQSRVPLGCVPAQSTTSIKLEVLPLTGGIITLDSLQIDVKEKGDIFVPEQELKINGTASIAKML